LVRVQPLCNLKNTFRPMNIGIREMGWGRKEGTLEIACSGGPAIPGRKRKMHGTGRVTAVYERGDDAGKEDEDQTNLLC